MGEGGLTVGKESLTESSEGSIKEILINPARIFPFTPPHPFFFLKRGSLKQNKIKRNF